MPQTYTTTGGRRVTIPDREPDALGLFLEACGTDPDTSRLNWLSSLLVELEADPTGAFRDCEDMEALHTAIAESRLLLDSLRAAVREATTAGEAR
jgi:hypothetical protein